MNRTWLIVGTVLAALVAFFLWLPEPSAPPPAKWPAQAGNSFLLRGVRVFDGERFLERQDVLVRDGRIAAVSPKTPVPNGIPEFAAAGHTLLPALIDAHTHNFATSRADALRFGVGTQIDLFTVQTTLAAARTQRESLDRVDEADMWSAGTLVTAPGGHGTQFGMPIPTLASSADADAFVAARIAEGSDFIKLVLESGAAWHGGTPTLDAATLGAAIAAAKTRGKLAVVHAGSHDEARLAIESGADGLVHSFGDRVADDGLIRLAAERGVFVVPTLVIFESVAGKTPGAADDASLRPWLSPAQVDSLRRTFPAGGSDRGRVIDNALATTRRMVEAGIPILAGSDAPNPGTAHGLSLHRELELLVLAGLTPAQALASATRLPAQAFGIADRGRVADGQRADLLLVEGHPGEDIRATRAIAAIWKNGYLVPRPRQDATAPAAGSLADGVLGRFDDGADGWTATTDNMAGGSSEVTVSATGGALVLDAKVESGAFWPWAGAIRMLGSQPMEPVSIAAFTELALRLRVDGGAHVLFFSGTETGGAPALVAIDATGDWQDILIRLADVPGFDAERARAIAVVAGPAPGAARIEIDSAVLR